MPEPIKRPGQQESETVMEYLRRAVQNLNHEPESILDAMPCVEAILDYFDLWHAYDTDFLEGIVEGINEGDDPKALNEFIAKWKLPWRLERDDERWLIDLEATESV